MEKMNINRSGRKKTVSVKARAKGKGANNMNNGNNRKSVRKPKVVPKLKPKVRVYTVYVPAGSPPPTLPEAEEAHPWVLSRAGTRRGDLYSRTVPVVEGMEPGMQALLDAFEGRVQIVDNDAVEEVIDEEVEGLAGAFGAAGVGARGWQWQPGAAAAGPPLPAAAINTRNAKWRREVAAARAAEQPLPPRGPVYSGPINMPRFGPAPPLPPPPAAEWGGENLGGGRRTRKKRSKKSKKSRRC